MKRFSILTAAIVLLSASFSHAQSPPVVAPAASSGKVQSPVPSNKNVFFVVAEFTQSISAKKLKAGDKIKAQVTQDVLSKGRILIPVESKLLGHVTEAKGRTPADQESRLGIVFDKIILKHHREVEFEGVIQSLEAPAQRKSKVDEPDQMLPPAVLGVSPNGGGGPMGGSTTSHGSSSSATMSHASTVNLPTGAPIYVDGTPGSNAGNSAGGDLSHPSKGPSPNAPASATPLSTGMPQGVFGIKGLNLAPGSTTSTPGPVITSSVRDVKLEYGTQVLVKITDPHVNHP